MLQSQLHGLRNADNNPLYRTVARESISEILRDFIKPDLHALLEKVGPGGEFLDEADGREVNPANCAIRLKEIQ